MHRKRSKEDVDGFVVASTTPLVYLGWDLIWYEHTGPDEAFVFTRKVIVAGGEWATPAKVKAVIPAHYDHKSDTTVVTGDPIPYPVFLAELAAKGVG